MSSSEDTLIGNDFRFQVGNGASPEVFSNMCSAVELNGIGEESPLIDTTSMCDQARTYRPGLKDGIEAPLVVNFIQGDSQIQNFYTAFKNKTLLNLRMLIADTSPEEYFEFTALVRGWSHGAPVGEKSTMTFTLKATGEVNWVFAA